MTSSIARGRVRKTAATTTVKSRKMVAILQIIGQVHSSSSSYVLLKLTTDQVLVFDWFAGSCQVKYLKTELGFSEAC